MRQALTFGDRDGVPLYAAFLLYDNEVKILKIATKQEEYSRTKDDCVILEMTVTAVSDEKVIMILTEKCLDGYKFRELEITFKQ